MTRICFALTFGAICFLSCSPQADPLPPVGPNPEPVPGRTVATLYTTTANKSKLFEKSTVALGETGLEAEIRFTLDKNERFQEIVGFGPAMTGASCYNIIRMSPEDRSALLRELFDPKDGLGISLVRVSIGSSDFSVDEDFTYCDEKGIANFAVPREDREYLFPVLREASLINPDLKIIGSPWTCPLWMKRMSVNDDSDYVQTDKTASQWAGGSLKPSCYEDYAQYFVKWIRVMQDEGFNVYAVTVQNEPYNRYNTASLYMTWQEQRDFVKDALGPAFAKAGITTKIICYDHNYDGYNYPLRIYEDAGASKYIAGSAWHDYAGKVSALDNVVAAAPDKEIYFTEASIGEWNYGFAGKLISDMQTIFMSTMERGCKGITLWNLALDEKNGPYRHHGCATCYGAITISSTEHKVIDRLSHYYDIAHCSKVIKPGAVRIGVNGNDVFNLFCQAFLNPDGSRAVIFLNKMLSGEDLTVVLDDGEHSVECVVPSYSIVSAIW